MKDYFVKVRHILPTFVLIAFGTTISYLLFRWFFTIHTNLISIREDALNIWIPMILPWIPILIWLRPKLRILKFKDKDKGQTFYQLFAAGTIIAMLLVSNSYLIRASGKLTEVDRVDELPSVPTKYISINQIDLDRSYGSVYADFSASGKHNQTFNIDLYFVYPFKMKEYESSFTYWYGIKYHTSMSNNSSNQEKETAYRDFLQISSIEFENYNFFEPGFYKVLEHGQERDCFYKSIENKNLIWTDNPIILSPQEGSYADRCGNRFAWIFGSFFIGLGVYLILLMIPKYDERIHNRQKKGIKPRNDDLLDMLKYLIPSGDHFSTSIIVNINILVFLIMIFSGVHPVSPKAQELFEWGGNRWPDTANDQWWRLVSSMFIHGGLMHLLLNIYGLVIAAMFVEPIYGRVKYLLLYFGAGICGSLASITWYDNTVSVGASGAIFGLYGALLGLLLANKIPKESRRLIFLLVGPFVVINLIIGVTGGIDNAAHIGGLVSGAIIGLILYKFAGEKAKEVF